MSSLISKNLALAFTFAAAAVATGCAADGPDNDDPNNPDNPDNPDNPTKPLDASGTYSMRSNFDLATNAPGKVGEVTRAIIDATDSPEDPTMWILERVIEKMGSGPIKSILQGSKSFVAGYLNDRLLDIAPDFVDTMVQVGQDFGQIAKGFGLNETLAVTKSADGYVAVHTALGAHFNIDGVDSDLAFSAFQLENVVVENVGVSLDQTGNLGIADHKVGLSLGKVLRVGLDGAIIPSLEPTAHNLSELLVKRVDCARVASALQGVVTQLLGYGGPASTYQTACNLGLVAGANAIYSKINSIDSNALEFGITGTARGIDKNGDKMIDSLQTGAWTGMMTYGTTPAPLANATFYGERK